MCGISLEEECSFPPLQMIGVPCSRNGGVIAHTGNDRAAQEVVIYFKSRNAATPHILKRAETVHHSYLIVYSVPTISVLNCDFYTIMSGGKV